MITTPLAATFHFEDIGRAPATIAALCIARITALESVLGSGSAIRWHLATTAAPQSPAAAGKRSSRQVKPKLAKVTMSGEAFFDARMSACRAVAAEHGEHWHLVEGASQWCSIPSKLRSFVYTSARGSTRIKCRADARLPAARYWPAGALPDGVIVAPEIPRDRTPAEVVRIMQAARKLNESEREYRNARQRAESSNKRYHDSRFGYRSDSYWAEERESDIVNAWNLRRTLREARKLAAELGKGKPLTLARTSTRNPRAEVKSCEMDYHAHTVALHANRFKRAHDDYNKGQWRKLVQAAWDSRARLRAARAADASAGSVILAEAA